MKKIFFWISALTFLALSPVLAQTDRKDATAVTYEELYDEPYSVNKLFVGFQPFYGEVFATNVNAGYGIELSYYLKEKADFRAHMRKTYSKSFYDFSRNLASQNSNVDITPEIFNYFEVGGTYHVRDFDVSSKTKMSLYRNSYKGDRWASRVPLHAEVPCKLRKIYGVRVGAVSWNSTTDINRALEEQGLTNADLKNEAGEGLPVTYQNGTQQETFNVFSNIYSTAPYLGGSMTWIRNVAVSFDKYEEGIDDGIITLFFDIMYAPLLKVDPIKYDGADADNVSESYSIEALKLQPLGFRLGLDGKFNRTLGWAYGGEVGYRPSIKGRTFFAMFKLCFPIYGSNLDYKVESFGK